jgi:hypothetical protein
MIFNTILFTKLIKLRNRPKCRWKQSHAYSCTLRMEATYFSKTSADFEEIHSVLYILLILYHMWVTAYVLWIINSVNWTILTVTTSNYSLIANLPSLQFSTACSKSSQPAVSLPVSPSSLLTFTTGFLLFCLPSQDTVDLTRRLATISH